VTHRAIFALGLAASLSACDDPPSERTGPTGPVVTVDARGVYAGEWGFRATVVGLPLTADCTDSGTLTIASQTGASFSGSFVIDGTDSCWGESLSGSIESGSIDAFGAVAFKPRVDGAAGDLFDYLCGAVSEEAMTGVLAEGRISAEARDQFDCNDATISLRVSVLASR